MILDYVGSTHTATVSAWVDIPTSLNTFEIKNAGSEVLWRYDTIRQRWYRTPYPATFGAIIRDANGNILAGDTDGNVWRLEEGTQDNGADIPVTLWTPIEDDGAPLSLKTAFDLQAQADTGGANAQVDLHLDGSNTSSDTLTVASSTNATHHQSIYGLADYARLQIRLTGSFSRFILRWLNVSYRIHPPQQFSWDTGYIMPPNGGDFAWVARVEVSLRSPSDLELVPTFDDVVRDTLSLPVVADKTSTYNVLLKRGQDKGRRPRFLLRTTAAAGSGNIGAECYWMRVHFRGTGNKTENMVEIVPNAITQGSA